MMKRSKLFSFLLLLILFSSCRESVPNTPTQETKQHLPPDDRYGQLFIDVQMAKVFPDGKTFVDCTPKFPTDQIVEKYQQEKDGENFDLKSFVLANFELPKQYASGFQADANRTVEQHINALWEILTREPDQATTGTLIPLPNSYIVPGGRFGEIYYWDSYFTMLGLQVANKEQAIENMVDNFAYLLDTIGFIPNGNRTYFNSRSQPPFFAMMVKVLAEMKGEAVFTKYLPALEKEYQFWTEGLVNLSSTNPTYRRLVRLKDGSILNRYWDDRNTPRAEMYHDDVETAKESDRIPSEVYQDIRAACESGWDFSSRWFEDPQSLSTIRTSKIIPVDLNALLFNLELTLAQAYSLTGDEENFNLHTQKANQRRNAVFSYCWSETNGFFLDYDFEKDKHTAVPSIAGMYPFFMGMADTTQALAASQVIERDFLKAGGVLSTLNNNGQQWDAPNGWAPLQWVTIKGLRNYGITDLASTIKQRWIDLNTKVYQNTGKMVEKYNVVDMGLEAGGGEYPVQDGFGWTNGVLLRLLRETN